MPQKIDKIPIKNELLDKRVKLTDIQKQKIFKNEECLSHRQLAKKYNVSRRLISFILNPEQHTQNLLRRKERGGSKIYYDKEEHRKAMKKHRDYKKELYEKKLI